MMAGRRRQVAVNTHGKKKTIAEQIREKEEQMKTLETRMNELNLKATFRGGADQELKQVQDRMEAIKDEMKKLNKKG